MQMDHEQVGENIDAWALGALDADEARALEQHLSGCATCTLLADGARDTAGAIALAVPLQAANSALKAQVLAGVAVLNDVPRRQPRAWRYWPAAVAAAIVVSVGLVGWSGWTQNEMKGLRDENALVRADATEQSRQFATVSTQLVFSSNVNRDLTASQDAVTEIVSQPDMARLALAGTDASPASTGRYVWSSTAGIGSLVARGLDALPEGKKYCLWIIYENDWVAGGLFDVDDEGTGRMIVRDVDAEPTSAGKLRGFSVSIEDDEEPVVSHEGETVLEARIAP